MEEKNKKPDQKENTRERYSQSDPITQSANPKQSRGGQEEARTSKGRAHGAPGPDGRKVNRDEITHA